MSVRMLTASKSMPLFSRVLIASELSQLSRQSRGPTQVLTLGNQRPCRFLQTGSNMYKKQVERPSEPHKFTTSGANIKSMYTPRDSNPYEKQIVLVCMLSFFLYFFVLREENDLDESLNTSLFERVPHLEEPHLRQAIPRMKVSGVDTTEAEARLKVLVKERLLREREAASK